jgi:hypothetical protein
LCQLALAEEAHKKEQEDKKMTQPNGEAPTGTSAAEAEDELTEESERRKRRSSETRQRTS